MLHVPGLTVEYRNQPNAPLPLGFAAPLSCAPVPVISDAALVVTVGSVTAVVNEKTLPNELLLPLSAIAQK